MKFLKEHAKITEKHHKKYLEQKQNNSNRIIKIIANLHWCGAFNIDITIFLIYMDYHSSRYPAGGV